MRNFILSLFIIVSSLCCAQNRLCRLRVIDDATGEAMPCVHVIVNGVLRGVSNAEGDVSIVVAKGDTVMLSSLGYADVKKEEREIGRVVRMQMNDIWLEGANVLSDLAILKNVCQRLKAEYKEGKKMSRLYFNRFSIRSGNQLEMVEGVIDAKSAQYLRDLKLAAGKYYGLADDGEMKESALRSTNLHKMVSISPMVHRTDNPEIIVPFGDSMSPEDIMRKYAVKSEVYDDHGRLMHRMTFENRGKDGNRTLCGTAFIDATTFRLARFEGTMTMALEMTKQNDAEHIYTQASKLRIIANYTDKRGFTEVDDALYEIVSENVAVRSHLYAVSDSVNEDIGSVSLRGNMLEAIKSVRNEEGLDEYRDVIKRTEGESLLFRENDVAAKQKTNSANDRLLSYLRHAMHFNKAVPQEKVYLHLDNTGYFEDETVRFKAYLTRTDKSAPSDLSKVLYVELLNMSGDVVKTTKWHVDSLGQSHGDMKLDSLLGSGFYEIRAYTRYMTNWGPLACFSRVIPVFKKPAREGDYGDLTIKPRLYRHRDPNNRDRSDSLHAKAMDEGISSNGLLKTISMRFYPEGGKLVEGKKSRVAVMAAGDNGYPYEAEGFVVNAQGDVLTQFTTDSLGRATFEVMPDGNPITVQMRNRKSGEGRAVQSFLLPKAEKEGCVLTLDAVGDEMVASVQCSDSLLGSTLGCVLLHDGNIVYCDTMQALPLIEIEFDRSRQQPGVSQLTVFDGSGRILAERLFFICPPSSSDERIIVSSPDARLKPCGKVTLDVQSLPHSTISLSAIDAGTMTNGCHGDMRTWMLLSSDVRGYISNVGYYFEADDKAHRQAADLLMLTQGWRRYDWELMDGVRRMERPQPVEDKFYVFGKLNVYRKHNPASHVAMEAFLYNEAGESLTGTTVTDSIGRYAFEMPFIDGEWKMQIYTRLNDKRKTYFVGIDRQISPLPQYVSRSATELLHPLAPNMFLRHEETSIDDGSEEEFVPITKKNHLLQNVTVKAKRRYFTNDDWKYKNEAWGRENATLYYDIDREREDILDKGLPTPTIFEYLCKKNALFEVSSMKSLPSRQENDKNIELHGNEHFSYGGRPIKWIVDNGDTQCVLDTIGITLKNISKVLGTSVDGVELISDEVPAGVTSKNGSVLDRFFPIWMEEIKSLYVVPNSPKEVHQAVRIYLYTHKKFTTESQKGLRRTYFQGFNKPSAFQMEDYSVIPPMADFRRTIYWNPNVRTDAKGKAKVEFYNNSTCREMYVSAEGMSDDGTILVSGSCE